MRGLLLADVVATSNLVAATRSRTAKTAAIAELLGRAVDEEIAPVTAWCSGELLQGRLGVGWAGLQKLSRQAPSSTASLTVAGVDAGFTPAQIGRAALVGQQVHLLSPLVPSTYLLVGLAGIEFGALTRTARSDSPTLAPGCSEPVARTPGRSLSSSTPASVAEPSCPAGQGVPLPQAAVGAIRTRITGSPGWCSETSSVRNPLMSSASVVDTRASVTAGTWIESESTRSARCMRSG